MSFEVDPKDGLPTFVNVETNGYRIKDLEDVPKFWSLVHDVGKRAAKEYGFVVYPIVSVEEMT
jgi:hypothetical protein